MGIFTKKSSSSVYWEEDLLIKKALGAGYPEPKLLIGDVFISNCEVSRQGWEATIHMLPGDKVLVQGVVPITRLDGSFTSNPEGPWWCYIFKNLTRGGEEFELQGSPSYREVIKRSNITRLLYE